jgi:DNA-binding transcriptional MocR family regulator
LIVPTSLIDAFRHAPSIDVNLPSLEQEVLADHRRRHFTRHIRRMRMLYAERMIHFD